MLLEPGQVAEVDHFRVRARVPLLLGRRGDGTGLQVLACGEPSLVVGYVQLIEAPELGWLPIEGQPYLQDG